MSRQFMVSAIVIGIAAGAHAQVRRDPVAGPGFDQIDQAVADINPLGTSLRNLQVDLRQPTGFANVYEVPGRPDLRMRINGGIFAIFPFSTYAQSRRGTVPLIPANTVFFIGEPSPESTARIPKMNLQQFAEPSSEPQFVDLRTSLGGGLDRALRIDQTESTAPVSQEVEGRVQHRLAARSVLAPPEAGAHPAGESAQGQAAPRPPVDRPGAKPAAESTRRFRSDVQSAGTPLIAAAAPLVNQSSDVDALLGTLSLNDADAPITTEPVRQAKLFDPNEVIFPDTPLDLERGGPSTIVTDAAYRLCRLSDLLMRAAHAESERQQNAPPAPSE
jgi:hypothetical protein